jgi:DNA-directed RNA polymerase specialized sigma subunit
MTWQGQPRGEDHKSAKLSENQVREIRARLALNHRQIDIAADYGVSQMTISRIARRYTWAWLDEEAA